MEEKLMERCRRQIENEGDLRQSVTLGSEESVKLGALLYTALGLKVDPDRILECQTILRDRTGLFSNFRGALQAVVLLKMTQAEDPAAYINDAIYAYTRLTRNMTFPGLLSVLAAITISEQHGDRDVDEVINRILEIYATVKEMHPYLTDESDMAYIALMLLSGKADIRIEEDKETIYVALKEKFHLPAEAAQSSALVLITGNKPVDERVDEFMRLYDALNETGHATAKNRCISIYGAFTDVQVPQEKIVEAVAWADQFLKDKKGYGVFSVSTDLRKVLAATLVLQHYTIDVPSRPAADGEGGVSNVSIEALLFNIIMNMVVLI